MDLTPRLLTEVDFREEWRGDSRRDVDAFLETVAAAVGELQERLREAGDRAADAERRLLDRAVDDDDVRRTLVLAQRTATTAVQEAQAEAERILSEADRRAREQLGDAEQRLADLEAELVDRSHRELGALVERRHALEADVATLQAFVDEHRGRLRAELQRQLAELDEPAPALELPDAPELRAGDVELPDAPEASAYALDEPEDELDPEPAALMDVDEPRAPTEDEVARAREELVEALRRAGVEDLLGSGVAPAPEPDAAADAPEPDLGEDPTAEAEDEPELTWVPEQDEREDEPALVSAPQLYDAADESGEIDLTSEGEPTGIYDVFADVGDDDALEWKSFATANGERTGEVHVDDDPFLAELRRAVTDTEPLGPRSEEDLPDMGRADEDAMPSGRFRLRRGR